jgi:hypothetical protein
MLQCIVLNDIIYAYPVCVIESGKYGKGYIYGRNPNLPDKPTHLIKNPHLKEWYEDNMIQIVILEDNYLIPLDRDLKWDLIERWCNQGANMEFFTRQF